MANSSSTVEIIFKATDLVSATAGNIKDAISQLNEGNKKFKAPQGLKDTVKEFGKLDGGGKIQVATGALSAFGDKLRSIDTTMNNSGLGKLHNVFSGVNSGISDITNSLTGVASAIHPALGLATQLTSIFFKAHDAIKKVKLELASPVANLFGGVMKELTMPMGGITKGFQNWRSTLSGIASGVYVVKNAITGVSKAMESVDQYATNRARLGMVAGNFSDGSTQKSLYKDVYKLSLGTRSSMQSSADIVSKLGINVGSAFKDTKELLRFTETVDKAMTIGGSSGTERQGAMLQLQQALASGKLQGDEFRSLSENAPYLMEMLAKGLGVTRGELKQLGTEGKLTTEAVIGALLKGSAEVDEAFNKIPMRFNDLMNKTKGAFQMAMTDTYDTISGFLNSTSMQKVIAGLTPVFEKFGKGVSNVFGRVQEVFDTFVNEGTLEGISKIFEKFTGLSMILGGLFKGGILGEAVAFMGILKELGFITGKTMPKMVESFSNFAKKGLRGLSTSFVAFSKKVIPEFVSGLFTLGREIPSIIDGVANAFSVIGGQMARDIPNIMDGLASAIMGALDGIERNIPSIGETALKILNALGDGFQKHSVPLAEKFSSTINSAIKWATENKSQITGALQGISRPIGQAVNTALEKVDWKGAGKVFYGHVKDFTSGITEEIDLGNIISVKTDLLVTNIKTAIEDALSSAVNGISNVILDLLVGKENRTKIRKQNEEYKKATNTPENQARLKKEQDRGRAITEGMKAGWNKFTKGGFFGTLGNILGTTPMSSGIPNGKFDPIKAGLNTLSWLLKPKVSKASDVPEGYYQGGQPQTPNASSATGSFVASTAKELNSPNSLGVIGGAMTALMSQGLSQSGTAPQTLASMQALTQSIYTELMTMTTTLGDTFTLMFTSINTAMTAFTTGFVTQMTTLTTGLTTAFTTLGTTLVTTLTTTFSLLNTIMASSMLGMSLILTTSFTSMMQGINTIVVAEGALLQTNLTSAMELAMTGMVETTISGGQAISSALSSALSSAHAVAMGFTGSFFSVGLAIARGVASGVTAGAPAIVGAVRGAMGTALAAGQAALQVNSPSKVFAKVIGRAIPEGVAKGITDNVSYVKNAINDMARSITSPLDTEQVSKSFGYSVSKEDIKDAKEKVSEDIKAEILSASRVKYIERFSKITNAPTVNLNGNINQNADAQQILRQIEKILAEQFESDLAISKQ